MINPDSYVPPSDIPAEQAVLGAMLLDRGAIDRAGEILQPTDFYRDGHEIIFAAIMSLSMRREPVDMVTLRGELQSRGQLDIIGGLSYLAALFDATPTAAHVVSYATIVQEMAVKRRLLEAAHDIAGAALDKTGKSLSEITAYAAERVVAACELRDQDDFVPMPQVLREVYDEAEQIAEGTKTYRGFSTGFEKLDEYTLGLVRKNMVVIAARPGMGKTSLALTMGMAVAQKQRGVVAMFSFEMGRHEIAKRLITQTTGAAASTVSRGLLKPDQWGDFSQMIIEMDALPLYISDTTKTIADMRAMCRRLQVRHGLDMVIIDYLQQVRASRQTGNRTQEIDEISRGCKSLAMEMDVPVVVLAQLSREVERRSDKHPVLSDLRESGGIEADADVVILLYNEAYYEGQAGKPSSEPVQPTELMISKVRNGYTGVIRLGFEPAYARFCAIAERDPNELTGF